MKISDSRWKVGRVYGMLSMEHHGTPLETLVGTVLTPHGFVRVWAMKNTVNLRFVWRGYEHTRHFSGLRKPFTARGLAIIAGRYAKSFAR